MFYYPDSIFSSPELLMVFAGDKYRHDPKNKKNDIWRIMKGRDGVIELIPDPLE